MRRAWLGFGGNIGDVKAALATALRNLDRRDGIVVTTVSPLYMTPPWGIEDQPWFLNCCAGVVTDLSPGDLLAVCREQEKIGKRQRNKRWGPRTIDIDILLYEGVAQDDPDLTLPHPRMLERAFVLVPLANIAPDLELSDRLIGELVGEVDRSGLELSDGNPDWWRAV